MVLRFVNSIRDFSRECNLECDFDFSNKSTYTSVYCTFFNPANKKHITYEVAIAYDEDLDGMIETIKEDVKEEVLKNDKENSVVSDKEET